ncbi:sigma factor [Actinoallomurus sp. NPDC052274]|uniref:sigma factor n=1 Tax=Actinoallomurus sp. NPDC052274 TaxID=3155420 RepID=UPI00343E8E42
MTEEEELAAEFETQRSYLHAIAFRMLGSHADADDAVQEAWLRLARSGRGGIEDLRGWLTTVTSRICLDALRRRGARGEQSLELHVGALPGEAIELPNRPRGGGRARRVRRPRAVRRHGRPHAGGTGVVRGRPEYARKQVVGGAIHLLWAPFSWSQT